LRQRFGHLLRQVAFGLQLLFARARSLTSRNNVWTAARHGGRHDEAGWSIGRAPRRLATLRGVAAGLASRMVFSNDTIIGQPSLTPLRISESGTKSSWMTLTERCSRATASIGAALRW
jgi:hypothetical protein